VCNLAERVKSGTLDFDRLTDLPDDEVRERLTAVKGIGRWSADMFLLRELGRPDILPSGDVGIRNAVQRTYNPPRPPTPAEVNLLGEKWRPHRSLAAAYLFASLDATKPKPVMSGHLIHKRPECMDSNMEVSRMASFRRVLCRL
jgi:DNA-3-methyladenine glycosylase II